VASRPVHDILVGITFLALLAGAVAVKAHTWLDKELLRQSLLVEKAIKVLAGGKPE
jgi:hypothetical protein